MQRLVRALVAGIVPALVLLSGCEVPTQTQLTPEPPVFAHGGQPDLAQLAKFKQRPQITIAWAKAWIGPEGGRVDFHGFAIEVPPGAVDKVTMFSIQLPVDPQGSEYVVAEFGPHNVAFAKPVTIELPYAGTSLETSANPTVLWWDPSVDAWVDMDGFVTSDGQRVGTQTPHFSTYGTADGAGVTTAGG